jgi:hypothetical protein
MLSIIWEQVTLKPSRMATNYVLRFLQIHHIWNVSTQSSWEESELKIILETLRVTRLIDQRLYHSLFMVMPPLPDKVSSMNQCKCKILRIIPLEAPFISFATTKLVSQLSQTKLEVVTTLQIWLSSSMHQFSTSTLTV